MVEKPQLATGHMLQMCTLSHESCIGANTQKITSKKKYTLSFQSVADLYGDLKRFRDRFPADKLKQFRQSKNLSNISAKRAVSCALGPTDITRA